MAALQYLANRKLSVPQDVSMACCDSDPHFAWCDPEISHIGWDANPVVQRILRWADAVSCGREDRRQTETRAEFIAGGTIGPAP